LDVGELRRALPSGPDRARILNNLSISLYSRFRCSADIRDVDAAILHARAMLRLIPLRSPDRAPAEGNLATFLVGRRADGDLGEAAVIARRALVATPPGRHGYAESLAQVAEVEFELFKDDNDAARLDAAIEMYAELVTERPLSVPGTVPFHLNYAIARLTRFGRDWSRREDLDAALSSLTELADSDLAEAPPGARNAILAHLIQALSVRHQIDGDAGDLARVADLRTKLEASDDPALGTRGRALLYDNAATASLTAFLRTGDLSLLDRAIREQQEALSAVPEGHPDRPALLGNLGLCRLLRHREKRGHGEADEDLSAGMALAREAVQTSAGGVAETASAGILGTVLLAESVKEPGKLDPDQVDLAIELLTRARDGLRPDDPQRAAAEAKLSQGLALRSLASGDLAGLRAAIAGFAGACALMPAGSPYAPGMRGGLADLLLALAAATGAPDDIERAVSAARAAVEAGSERHPAGAFDTALQWGTALWRLGRLDLAGEGYAIALRILHDLTRTQLTMPDKQAGLTRVKDITARAAVALAYAGRPAEAALAVETGRAVTLSEAVGIEQARVLDVAAREHPELVAAYQRAATEVTRLQRDPANELAMGMLAPGAPALDHQAALRAARLTLDSAVTALEQALDVELLRPPTWESLSAAVETADVPVVYLAASDAGGTAVVVEPNGLVRSVPLPSLTEDRVAGMTRLWRRAVDDGAADVDATAADQVAALMWSEVMAPVTAALAGQPRAALVAGGGLGVLPLHAAGWQDPDGTWHYATDVVSLGYAPNARVLAVCAQRAGRVASRPVLLVAEPETSPHFPPLPAAIGECEEIRCRFAESDVLARRYQADATLAEVRAELPRAALMHFACHAEIDRSEILDSAIILAGDERLTIRELLRAQLPAARLAVLSACSSARIGDDLQDEVVSFPSALAQAGVAGVLGSLWKVRDTAAAVLAVRFYELWLSGELAAPAALAGAQRWLREATNGEIAACYPRIDMDRPDDPELDRWWQGQRDFASPALWAPFIFMGA
jgi:CHAT domain-containing protein/tetratricopeptide (TPR) repeat protein